MTDEDVIIGIPDEEEIPYAPLEGERLVDIEEDEIPYGAIARSGAPFPYVYPLSGGGLLIIAALIARRRR